MKNEDAQKILEAIRAEPVPKTMLDELTESQQKIVLATLHGVEMIIDKRDKSNRSFWRAVFNALWTGAGQAHKIVQGLFKD